MGPTGTHGGDGIWALQCDHQSQLKSDWRVRVLRGGDTPSQPSDPITIPTVEMGKLRLGAVW